MYAPHFVTTSYGCTIPTAAILYRPTRQVTVVHCPFALHDVTDAEFADIPAWMCAKGAK